MVLDSVSQSPEAGVVVDVLNEANNASFLLQVMPLQGGMLRRVLGHACAVLHTVLSVIFSLFLVWTEVSIQ